MASLIERLQKLQIQAPEELPDLSQYSLEQMDGMKIEFGTKHVGKTYKEVWSSDQQRITGSSSITRPARKVSTAW